MSIFDVGIRSGWQRFLHVNKRTTFLRSMPEYGLGLRGEEGNVMR